MAFKTAAEMRYNIKPVEAFQEPMVYTKEIQKPRCGVLIAQGFYNGLNYYVKNINGRHPTAYVEIPQGHKAFGKDFCNYEFPQLIEVHGGESTLEFPAVDTSIKPDIYLAPLKESNFNRAKSNLKLLEATAVGAAFLGSDFEGSPYAEAHPLSKVKPWTTPEQLDAQFDQLCRHYAEVMEYQRKLMDMQGYWMESDHYLKRYLHTYFGDYLLVNGRKL